MFQVVVDEWSLTVVSNHLTTAQQIDVSNLEDVFNNNNILTGPILDVIYLLILL